MQVFFYTLIFLVAVLLQLKLIPLFAISGARPDLILIMTLFIAFRHGKIWGVVAGFSAGLLVDLFGTSFVGLSSLGYSIAAFIAGFLGSEQLERRLGVILVLFFFVIFVHAFLYYTIFALGTNTGFWHTLLHEVLPNSLYTLVFIFMLYLALPKKILGGSGHSYVR